MVRLAERLCRSESNISLFKGSQSLSRRHETPTQPDRKETRRHRVQLYLRSIHLTVALLGAKTSRLELRSGVTGAHCSDPI